MTTSVRFVLSYNFEKIGYYRPQSGHVLLCTSSMTLCIHAKVIIHVWSSHFLSPLLIAGCDIGVKISVRPYIHPYIHLRQSLVSPTSVIAVSVKPCIVIALDIAFKQAP